MDSSQAARQAASRDRVARWCRSLIVASGANLQRLYKVQTSDADIVLYDLEDSIRPANKEAARQAFHKVRLKQLHRPLGLRINCPRLEDGMRDLKMLESAPTQPLVLVLPKVESASDIQMVDDHLTRRGSQARLWAILESGLGVLRAQEIAQASERLAALSFGAADFCADLGIAMKWEPLLHARSQVVLAARTAGLGVLDSPTFTLDDPSMLASEATAAADLGFTGKIAIHPSQIKVINDAFSPTPEQVEWATSVVQALRHDSIISVRGQMVGPPFLRTARRILKQAKEQPV